jgi:hypothetical protein
MMPPLMELLVRLQDSAFSMWVLGSDSIWSYPTILTLHTVGLAILVGAALIIDLRVLGVGGNVPLPIIGGLYRYVWAGFLINLASGIVLFVVQAADHAVQPVFYIKLVFIAIAFGLALVIKRRVFSDTVRGEGVRGLAVVSLICWVAAITAGRLMAYV